MKAGTAIGGVEHRGERRGQRLDDLGGVGDPVPEARHRLERVVQAERRIAVMLELLEHGVGQAREEGVAAEHQERQPVGVGQRRGGQEVGGAGPGARGAEHEALAQPLFGIGGGREAHAHLVLAAIERQRVARLVESLAEAGDVAVPEDAEAAAADAPLLAVDLDELRGEMADDRLRRGEADRVVGHGGSCPPGRAPPRAGRCCGLRARRSEDTNFATGCKPNLATMATCRA